WKRVSGRVSLKPGQPRATVFGIRRRGRFAAWRSPTIGYASTWRRATGRRRTRLDEGRTAASDYVRPRERSEMDGLRRTSGGATKLPTTETETEVETRTEGKKENGRRRRENEDEEGEKEDVSWGGTRATRVI
uniref:Uncharacterized protein n=1 Tax=Cucumis melo TaxID=3656 RepID=A0A9I9E3B2_CUCME